MKLKEAFLVADRVVCHTCQTVTPHSVRLCPEDLEIVFTCEVCGEEATEFDHLGERCIDIAEEVHS